VAPAVPAAYSGYLAPVTPAVAVPAKVAASATTPGPQTYFMAGWGSPTAKSYDSSLTAAAGRAAATGVTGTAASGWLKYGGLGQRVAASGVTAAQQMAAYPGYSYSTGVSYLLFTIVPSNQNNPLVVGFRTGGGSNAAVFNLFDIWDVPAVPSPVVWTGASGLVTAVAASAATLAALTLF